MSDKPYMKLWVTDYLGDAHYLSVPEHGAYFRLLLEAWKTPSCSLPADPAWITRKLGITREEFEDYVRPVIAEFWIEQDHRIHQKRQRKEFEDASYRSEMAKMAANRRWSGRKVIPLKTKDND